MKLFFYHIAATPGACWCVSQIVCVFLIMRKFKTYCLANIFPLCFARERGHNIKPDLSDLLFPTYQVQILQGQL